MITVPTFGVLIAFFVFLLALGASAVEHLAVAKLDGRRVEIRSADADLERGERVGKQLRANVIDAVHQRRRFLAVVGDARGEVVPPQEFGLEPDDVVEALTEVTQTCLGRQVHRIGHTGRLRRTRRYALSAPTGNPCSP